jgi:copper(I)-binding protein
MGKVALLLIAVCLSACADDSAPLIAEDVIVTRPIAGPDVGAGFLTLTNTTDQAITISRVASPEFESVAMHESYIDDGIARMRPLGPVTIGPGQSIVFERGAKHLMLKRPTDLSDSVTLQFFSGDALVLTVVARVAD